MIKVKEVSKRYGDFKALDDISFNIKKGEVVGFLGPNGAGKTTTMKIITCFMPPSSGSVTVNGHDTINEDLDVRRTIGYLPESAPLYTEMEVRDYLLFIAQMRRIKSNVLKKKYDRVVEMCGLSEKLKMPISTLSKGYKQRVGLAQAMIHEPKILILDEPTSGLDPHQIVEIRKLIKDIGRDNTVLLSTHILPEVSATCSRVIIINKGRIVAEGTPDSLMESSKGSDIMHIAIEGPKSKIVSELNKIKHFDKVELIREEKKNLNHFKIFGERKKGEDFRKTVFDAVTKNKWSIYEMNLESMSLEDVFIDLTNIE